MAIVRVANGGGSTSGGTATAGTVYSHNPPTGLTHVVAGGAVSQTAALQSHLDYVKNTWGGGVVDISGVVNGAGVGDDILCGGTTGLTIPSGVQLRGDGKTKMYFADLTTGSAVTVNDNDFTPLMGIWLDGPNWNPTVEAYPSGDASVGLRVTGVGLRFYDLRIRYFGAGVHLAQSNTYILKFVNGSIGNCGVCIYDDGEGNSLTENGESIVFNNYTLHNSILGIWATGNNLDLYFTGGSIDYCDEFARISNAWVYFSDAHLETTGSGPVAYLFDVRNNSHVFTTNCQVIMGNRTALFNPSFGPTNYGYGRAVFKNVAVFYTNPSAVSGTIWSDHLYSWDPSTTTATYHTPFPLRWCAVDAAFCVTDGYNQPNTDPVQITAMGSGAGTFTLTSASSTANRWIRVRV